MLHMDEARNNAIRELGHVLDEAPKGIRAVLIDDLFGRLRLVLWARTKHEGETLRTRISEILASPETAGPFWSGEVGLCLDAGTVDHLVYEQAWNEARELVPGKLRLLDRHRSRGSWLESLGEPPWKVRGHPGPQYPPVIAFYSFKGGVGRSTALAAVAIQRARAGERVAVIDADLDAPGVGVLLSADADGTTARWGVVDYILEKALIPVDLRDYYHACRRQAVTAKGGEILVIPAGQVGGEYLGKLARLDLEPPPPGGSEHPLRMLLTDVRQELKPHWILVDVRAGLADSAGMFLGGFAHLHVLFGTSSEQSWRGLRVVIQRLGAQQIRQGRKQADCIMVHAMVPRATELFRETTRAFAERARDEFTELYYAEAGEDVFWTVEDAEGSDAPHVPVPLPYDERLSQFRTIDDVASLLAESPDYSGLAERILAYFGGSI